MLIDINKIIVNDRIRKDFGNIEELAEDIRVNGLINPPTVNKSYVLLAGERRLRACKSLGWTQIEVHMLDTKDEAHDLAVEMSENNMRRNFTGSELAEGIRRQMAIEAEKAKERMESGGVEIFPQGSTGKARDKAAEPFGISGKQAEKVLFVDDNRDLLDASDFAEWDEGKLSTNKAFQRIKAAQKRAEEERDAAMSDAEMTSMLYGQAKTQLAETQYDLESAKEELASERGKNLELGSQMESLKRQLSECPKPEVIEREVEVEVEVESKEAQRRIRELEHEVKIYLDTDQKLRKQLESTRKELDRAKGIIGMDKSTKDVQRDVEYLISATNQYVRHYGGLTWTFERIAEVDETTREELRKAVRNLATFSNALMGELEQM